MPVVIGQIQKSVLPDGAATEATLATRASEATLTTIAGFTASIPTRASEATLLAIKAKTDNLDVLLSTRAVTGLTDAQLRASAVPVSAAALPLPAGAATAALQTQPGIDIGDVTVNNAAGAGAVNIQDGGNSITVDGPLTDAQLRATAVPISAAALPLPAGAATEATLATRAAAAQLPAALVGGRLDENIGAWLGSTTPTVGQKTMAASIPVVIASDQAIEKAAFWSIASGIAPGTNKSMWSIVNAGGSAVIIKIQEIWIRNVQQANIAGVVDVFELHRITGHSAGTALTPLSTDTADALNGSVTAITNSTVAGEVTDFFDRWFWSSDEWGPGALDVESFDSGLQNLTPVYRAGASPRMKPPTLRAGEGFTLKQVTASALGTWDIVVKFTQE